MSQNNVYNFIQSAEEVDKKVYANGSGSSENPSNSSPPSKEDSDTPNAQDTTGLNVTTDAKTKAKKFEFKNLQGELGLTPTLKNFNILIQPFNVKKNSKNGTVKKKKHSSTRKIQNGKKQQPKKEQYKTTHHTHNK